jgi:ADP-heptose:LPS heptosyltransferase
MHILALVPGGIGEQFLFFPTLETLKRVYPEASIDVIANPTAISAYQVCPAVRRAVPFDFQDRNSLADWSNLLGIIREQEYEVALAAKGGFGVGVLLWLCGVPTRLGFSGSGTLFLTGLLPDEHANQYGAERFHALLKGLNLDFPCPSLQLNLPRQDLAWAEAEQARLDLTETGYLLVYPDCDRSGYPSQNWKLILQNVQERQPELPILLLQDRANNDLLATLNRAGIQYKTITISDIGKTAATIAGANLFLCPEGDLLQLAVAVQTFTIALFNDTKPNTVLPSNERFVGIQASTGKITDISPQRVLDTIFGNS